MKRKLLILSVLTLFAHSSSWAYDFSTENGDGTTLYCNILRSSNKTCEVTYYSSSSSTNRTAYTGVIDIPESVEHDNTTYSVTAIGDSAFYYCSDLTEVIIPESVTTIGDWAFWGCLGLSSLTLGNSVNEIGSCAFGGCVGLTKFVVAEDNQYYCEVDGVLFSKDKTTLVAFPISSPILPSYDIPNNVTTIGDWAFYYCGGLTSITIPDSVTTIGENAFVCCEGLTSITIPNSVTTIGERAFWYCSGLTSVTIPNSVKTIGTYTFWDCSSLTSLTLGNSVESIEYNAFWGCTSLTKFAVAEDNQYYCEVDGVLFSKDLTTLVAFPPSSPLSPSYDIPNNVTTIGDAAFCECSGLTSITIPNSVTLIGKYAFNECSGITSLNLGKNVETIGYGAFWYCTGLTSMTISNRATTIGAFAFEGCSSLTSVAIPNSVTTIGSCAFRSCSGITSLILGKNVETIGSEAFHYCEGLESVYTLNSEPAVCDMSEYGRVKVFDGVDKEACTLYVSIGSHDAYATADQWKDFLTIREVDFNTDLYDDLYDDLWEVEDLLSDAWNTIRTKYPNISDGYEDEYETLKDELEKLFQELLNAYKTGTLDDDMAEEIRAKLEEIRKRIEEFLADAVAADIKDIPIGNNNVNGEFQIYTLSGARVNTPTKGNVYIFRSSDGTAKKVFIK